MNKFNYSFLKAPPTYSLTQGIPIFYTNKKGLPVMPQVTLKIQWWTRLQPIRTAAEVPFKIVIEPEIRIPVYQKLSDKVKQLHLLGMSFQTIGETLGIDAKTAIKALKFSLNGR